MTKRTKRDLLLITFGICLFVALNNISLVIGFISNVFALCLPVVAGFVLAFVLNVPMRGFEKLFDKLNSKLKKPISCNSKNALSLLLTIISILLVFVIVFTIAVPQVTKSIKSLVETVDRKIPDFLIFLESKGIDTTFITEKLASFNFEDIVKHVTQGAFAIFETAVDATVVVVKYFSTTVFAIIIALYMLLDKNNLSRIFKKGIYAFMPDAKADKLYNTAYLIRDTFAKFLSGQCLEAVILAVIIFLLFTVFGLPYAGLIALLAAVFSFIPYIGSFVACAVGTLLTFIDSPKKALICIIVYVAAQFIEQQFIYPHVVGNSVGLSPFFTIAAVILGGNLFGVLGMLFFIPLFSVISTLLGDYITEKREAKKTDSSTEKLSS